ncbi:MAG TPA: aminopeptidase N [Acidimicrobiia bacterium]|nr:aminopeptidase N [Acidimicrobiia bacterium]
MPESRDRLTLEEAVTRSKSVSDVSYVLDLDLEAGAKTFRGDVTIAFEHSGGDTFLEWLGGSIERFEVNGIEMDPDWDGYRIQLDAAALQEENEIRVAYERAYDHTGEGFHQFVDPEDGSEYLYTQFEPYSAHRLMPCFDQPDLKATYTLTITAPSEWAVVTAGREVSRDETADGRSRRVFETTVPFSTYLLSVVAGAYQSVHDEHNGIPLGLYARASLMPHLDSGPLFELTKRSMDYFGELFSEPYPFGKYDQVFVPEFNWGGMENVANVTYTDTVIFRDPPTEDQLQRRAEYFTHELAHMWFGDLVTMKWWNDIWLNESFASYAGYLALDDTGDWPGLWQDFNFRMKLWAYREDQQPTTHPIADEVPSTDEVFLNFDGISYGKGASVLKQLVHAIGEDAFHEGLRTYFRRHRFGNANLADFLAALQEGSGMDLVSWAARWLRTASLNTLSVAYETAEGKVTDMQLRQSALEEHPVLRPHHVELALVDRSGEISVVPAVIDDLTSQVAGAVGLPEPAFVFPNHGDHGYAKVELDDASVAYAKDHLADIDDALLRQLVWEALWEMVRDRALASTTYLGLVARHLVAEQSLPIIHMVTATVGATVHRYVPEQRIEEQAGRFVDVALDAIEGATAGDLKVLWARALIGLAMTPEDASRAADLVDDPPKGLTVDQDMRWAVAVRWAALGIDGADVRLDAERKRDKSDRGDRAMTTAAVARPDAMAKKEAWERLHGDGYPSLRMSIAAAGGFWFRHQAELVEPYIEPFFAGLVGVFTDREAEAAKAYFRSMFPSHVVDQSMRERIAAVLEEEGIRPMLRRLLVEADDDLRRAMEARALAESTG